MSTRRTSIDGGNTLPLSFLVVVVMFLCVGGSVLARIFFVPLEQFWALSPPPAALVCFAASGVLFTVVVVRYWLRRRRRGGLASERSGVRALPPSS